MHPIWAILDDIISLEDLAKGEHALLHRSPAFYEFIPTYMVIGTANHPYEDDELHTHPIIHLDRTTQHDPAPGIYLAFSEVSLLSPAILHTDGICTTKSRIENVRKEEVFRNDPSRYTLLLDYLFEAKELVRKVNDYR